MSVGLRHSTIETFRRRYHGNAVLTLLQLRDDGDSLRIAATVEKGFYLATNSDTTEGAMPFLLTIDLPYTPALTGAIITGCSFVDLTDAATLENQRYRINTDTPPIVSDWRYVLGLHAAYNDRKAATI